jgi:hypothetical protein
MTQHVNFSNSQFNKPISSEQLNQIVEAILDGKYSWACVLLLRCAGYNPLQYIPYRTYNRLLKDNTHVDKPSQSKTVSINKNRQNTTARFNEKSSPNENGLSQISDLNYLEAVAEPSINLRGGTGANLIAFLMNRM